MEDILKAALECAESVLFSGFGKFEVKDKKPRKGNNPQTHRDEMVDARRVVTFKSSSALICPPTQETANPLTLEARDGLHSLH